MMHEGLFYGLIDWIPVSQNERRLTLNTPFFITALDPGCPVDTLQRRLQNTTMSDNVSDSAL